MLNQDLVKKFVNTIHTSPETTCWDVFAEDDKYTWAVVFGSYSEDGEDYIGVKIAYCPRRSAMKEYDIDWMMPYNKETNEVDDTEVLFEDDDNVIDSICSELSYFNNNIQRFMDTYVDQYEE